MYKKLNITENTLQILSLFTNDFHKGYYIREIARLLKISPRTAQLCLEDLESKGVIKSKVRGKIKLYVLNLSEATKRYIVFVEQYKAIIFLENDIMIKEIIEKITSHIKGIGIIFGSYVKKMQKEDSDLDIFVAGTYDEKEIKRVSRNLGIEISVKCYPIKTFENNINKDFLLKEIIKNHIIFVNAEQFIEMVLDNG